MWEIHIKHRYDCTGELKLMIEFHLRSVCTISLSSKGHFLEFPWEMDFGVISGKYLYL